MRTFTRWKRAALIVLVLSPGAFLLGTYVVTLQAVSKMGDYCMREEQLPDNINPIDVYAIGRDSEWLPLGFTCSWTVGPDQLHVVAEPNWTATVLVYGGLLATGASAVVVARTGRRQIN